MELLNQVSLFDLATVLVVGLSILLGLLRGFISEAMSVITWVLAIVAGRALAGDVGHQMAQAGLNETSLQYAAGFAVVVVAVLMLSSLLRLTLRQLVRVTGLGPVDRLLGGAFGAARGLAIVILLVILSGLTILPSQTWWRQARLSPILEETALSTRPWLPQFVAQRIHYR